MNRYLALGIVAFLVVWTALFTTTVDNAYDFYWFAATLPAWAFVAAGLVAWARRPENRTGRLMVLTGFLLLIPTLMTSRVPLIWTIGGALFNTGALGLFYLVLAYPRGFLARRALWLVVAAEALWIAIGILGNYWWDPRTSGCADCPSGLNLLQFGDPTDTPEWDLFLYKWVGVPLHLLALALVAVIVVVRWIRSSRPARRVLWPVYVPVLYFCLDLIYGVVTFQYFPEYGLDIAFYSRWQEYVTIGTLTLIPLTFLFGLLRARARRFRVGELVVELGRVPGPERLQEVVARTLGDPSVRVGVWSEQAGGYLTGDGEPLLLPAGQEGRATTLLEQKGRPLAAIVHDPALLDDPAMVDAVGAATRLAVENERLTAEVRAQLAEVRASRARIVAASDSERRRIERNLHDGAQQRLLALSLELAQLEEELAGDGRPQHEESVAHARSELANALAELRQLAHGLHPAILTDQGLRAALADIAERAPLPVELNAPDSRYPEQVEAAAYYLAAEALTNTSKHANASHARIHVHQTNGRLEIEIEDNGSGGASPNRGSGLRGLHDRINALDGTLHIHSQHGEGTRIHASIPCA